MYDPSDPDLQVLWVPECMPTINDIIDKKSVPKGMWAVYRKFKRRWHDDIAVYGQHLRPVESAYFTFLHRQPNRRTDPDNFCGGARKFILDAIQAMGVIRNDGWAQVNGFAEWWISCSNYNGVFVLIHPRRAFGENESMMAFRIYIQGRKKT